MIFCEVITSLKSCRIKCLLEEISNDWDKLNLAAKVLVLIGIFLFVATIFLALFKHGEQTLYKSIEVIFRSSLASVFGFILSSNIKNVCKEGLKNSTINNETYVNEDCKDICNKNIYYYNEGNSVQIIIALITSIISGIVILTIYILNIEIDTEVLSQFRDFMCMSIGFLLGESKIRKL